jgi:hypothetical protein
MLLFVTYVIGRTLDEDLTPGTGIKKTVDDGE